MDLVEVDVVEAESRERSVDRGQDVLAGEPLSVGAGGGRIEDLGRDHHLLAAHQVAQQPAGDDLAGPVGVHVGGVEEGEAELERATHDRLRCFLVEHPGPPRRVTEAHHPEREPRNVEPAPTEKHLLDHAAGLLTCRRPCSRMTVPSRSTVGSRMIPSMWTPAWLTPPKEALVPNARCAVPSTFSSIATRPHRFAPGFVPIPT